MDDLDFCRRRVVEYAATRGKPGFDQQKLHDMVNGCALRQELLRTDLKLDDDDSITKADRRGAYRPLELIPLNVPDVPLTERLTLPPRRSRSEPEVDHWNPPASALL